MKTSWNETERIGLYLQKKLSPEDTILFEAQKIIDPELKEKIKWQEKTYRLIQQYGRRQLRKEINAVHQKLFSEPRYESFRKKILSIF